MGKQIFVKIRERLGVLLAVRFLMTVTSMAVNAVQDNFNPSGIAD
jgi:hypothetical protein